MTEFEDAEWMSQPTYVPMRFHAASEEPHGTMIQQAAPGQRVLEEEREQNRDSLCLLLFLAATYFDTKIRILNKRCMQESSLRTRAQSLSRKTRYEMLSKSFQSISST